MPDLYADAAGADGININTENYSADPQFRDAENGDFSITNASPAFATGDTTMELAGSNVSDTYAGADITFTSTSNSDNTGVELAGLQTQADTATANGNTDSREGSTLQTFDIASPSIGAFEVYEDSEGRAIQGDPAAIAGSRTNPESSPTGTTEIDSDRTVRIVFRSDDIDEGTTQDPDVAAASEDRILIDTTRRFTVVFDTEGALTTDEDGNIVPNGDRVFTDERTDRNNGETREVTTTVVGTRMPTFTVTTIDGTEVTRTRRGRGIAKCPREVPLIGTDYNLNTLICISEQYDRNVVNVPFGLGIGWAQGPPAIRLRGKNVYRVLNNSPSTDYVK